MNSRSFSPATSGEQDEEEVAALVPPAPEEKGDHTAVPSPGPPRPSLSAVLLRTSAMAGLVFLALLVGFGRWIMPKTSFLLDNVSSSTGQGPLHHSLLNSTAPFTCSNGTSTTCPATAVPLPRQWPPAAGTAPSCPDYFRYIHDDLRPWRDGGITRDAMERARKYAYFRLVVVGGRAYVETYQRPFQTRDVFSQWGILQLMRRYPGRVPDLDIMFACDDLGQVRVADFPTPSDAPPVFRYCKDDSKLDILFPDWSFWGWPEVGIRPWTPMLAEVERENDRVRWSQREPQAFWKGNPNKYYLRDEMMNCNVSNGKEWNARLFNQDWSQATRNGFKDSNIPKQCLYRYKIYIEGYAWSVSEKYILACDSPVLFVETPFHDILSRGLVAGKHYWPISRDHMCESIKFAVDWGNEHPVEVQLIGEQGSRFVREEMSMDYVYDYMLHLFTEYAKLLRYKPAVPEKAVEICTHSMACPAEGLHRKCMMDSMERHAADLDPCALPPPFTPTQAKEMADKQEELLRSIQKMEKEHDVRP